MMYTDVHQNNIMAIPVTLQRRLDQQLDGDDERQFFTRAIRSLATISGRQIEPASWMVTSYEVEFGFKIGSGGLCVLCPL
jgi:hypothetical protein